MLHPTTALPYLIAFLVFGYCTCVPAQDVSFRQLNTAPLLTNPALTGVMDGQFRVTANYQTLFTGLGDENNYRSVAAGVERKFDIGKQNFAGAGLQVQHDRAGSSDFVRSQLLASGGYRQRIGGGLHGRAQYLAAGAQVGAGQRGYDLNKIWFSEQYFVDPATRAAYLDRSLPSGEPFSGAGTQWYLDLSAGVSWLATFGDRRSAYAGAAVYHLTRPNVSPQPEETDLLYRRFVVHGGGELQLGERGLSMLPAFSYQQQGPSYLGVVGSTFRYTERGWREVALRVGGFLQVTRQPTAGLGLSAVLLSVGLELEGYQVGVSYDLAVGNLGGALNGRGGFELSAVHNGTAGGRSSVRCPKF